MDVMSEWVSPMYMGNIKEHGRNVKVGGAYAK